MLTFWHRRTFSFRDQYLKDTKNDPFSSITIASACMKVLETNVLLPKTLTIPLSINYQDQYKNYSDASVQRLEWEAKDRKIFIQHMLNKGEKRTEEFHLDGFSEMDDVQDSFWGAYHCCLFSSM